MWGLCYGMRGSFFVSESIYNGDMQIWWFRNAGPLVQILGTSPWLMLSQQQNYWRCITCNQTFLLTPFTARVKWVCLTSCHNFCLNTTWGLNAAWLRAYNIPFSLWSFASLSFPILQVFIPILLQRTSKNIWQERSSYFRTLCFSRMLLMSLRSQKLWFSYV